MGPYADWTSLGGAGHDSAPDPTIEPRQAAELTSVTNSILIPSSTNYSPCRIVNSRTEYGRRFLKQPGLCVAPRRRLKMVSTLSVPKLTPPNEHC